MNTNPFLRRASTSSTFIPKMKIFSSPISSVISTFAPSSVPIVSEPFNYKTNQHEKCNISMTKIMHFRLDICIQCQRDIII